MTRQSSPPIAHTIRLDSLGNVINVSHVTGKAR